MIAKIAVYIEVSWGFGGTEHDCSDLAGTLGTGAGGLCDGCHQTVGEWVGGDFRPANSPEPNLLLRRWPM
jgi:hypothetical protein